MIYARLIYGMFIQALLIACDTSITQAANTPPLEKFSTKRIQKTEQNVSILYNLYNRDTTRYTRAFQFAGKFTRHETRNLRRTVTEFSAKDREKWPYEKSSQAGKHSSSVLYYPFQSDFSTLMSPITLPMAKNKSNTHFREGNISLPRYKRSADTADAKGVKTNVPKPVLLQNYNKLKTEIENITIATVLPYSERMLFSIQRVQPAIDIAIEKVNPTLDKLNKRLIVKFRDSQCDNANSMNEAIGFYVRKEMHVLFGPCCDYAAAPIARQVQYWDIPMITAGAFAGDFGRQKDRVFRLLTRVGSNFNTLFDFFVNVLSMHKWRKMNIIYDPYGQTDNSEKFCHIVADGFHHEFRNNDAARRATNNVTLMFALFEDPEEILKAMPKKIGIECAGCVVNMVFYYR